jgi:hypothetical protein
MFRARALLLPPLILLLVVTGMGLGMARGAMAADGQLCSITGPAPVVLAHDGLPLFDAEGEPVMLDRSTCLDCLLQAFDLPPMAVGGAMPEATSAAVLRPSFFDWKPSGASPGGLARAPPVAA